MKKPLLLILSGLLLSAISFSQEKTKKIEFGVQAGFSLARMLFITSADVMDLEKETGSPVFRLHGGLVAEVGREKMFSFQTGVNYTGLGSKTAYDGTISTNYITIPAIVKFNPGKREFSLFAGPQAGLLTSVKTKAKATRSWFKMEKDDFKEFDISAILGIAIRPENGPVVISVYHQRSLSNILPRTFPQFWSSIRHNVFTLSVGYRF